MNLNSCQKGKTEYLTFDGSRLVTVDLSPVAGNEGSISSVGVGKKETNKIVYPAKHFMRLSQRKIFSNIRYLKVCHSELY